MANPNNNKNFNDEALRINRALKKENDALKEIAIMAIKRKTGARGLRSIIENLLIDLMFETPDQKELKKIVINGEVVKNKSQPILLFSQKENNQKLAVNKSWFF